MRIPYTINLLPRNLEELAQADIDWREVTADFDFDMVNIIIRRWINPEERRVVARMIGSQMSVNNLNGISADTVNIVNNLLTMYQYKEGSKEYNTLERLVNEQVDSYRINRTEQLSNYKQSVEKMKAQLKDAKELDKSRIKEIDKWHGLYDQDENKIVELAADNAKKDREIRVLKQQDLERHRKLPTADDFVKRLVKEAKKLYKHDNDKIEVIRQILYNLGCIEAEAELDAWIEGREYKPSVNVEGDYVVTKNVENEVNGVAAGATGITNNK